MFADHIKAFDSTEEIAESLLSFVAEGVDIFAYPEEVQGVTFEEACTVAHEIFARERFVLSVVKPLITQEESL